VKIEARWTGEVRFLPDRLLIPLAWRRPRRIFVNSTSDLFHEKLAVSHIDKIFAVMALADRHVFQVLTKRTARMMEYLSQSRGPRMTDSPLASIARAAERIAAERGEDIAHPYFDAWLEDWPLRHIWIGASAEDQETYDARRRDLEIADARVIWWSLEPLLGPIRLRIPEGTRRPDWIVVGGESGPDARPMHPDWARAIRDACQQYGIPFFFKQWGEWIPLDQNVRLFRNGNLREWKHTYVSPDTRNRPLMVFRAGKADAGRELDGKEWSEYPHV
jgi:protein gp37